MADTNKDAETDDTGQIDTGTGEQEPPEWKPPTEDEWNKTQRALAKANAESKQRREKLAELQAQNEDATGKAAREQAEAAQAKYKPIAMRAAAKPGSVDEWSQ